MYDHAGADDDAAAVLMVVLMVVLCFSGWSRAEPDEQRVGAQRK